MLQQNPIISEINSLIEKKVSVLEAILTVASKYNIDERDIKKYLDFSILENLRKESEDRHLIKKDKEALV